jgi:hypothetical protein
MKHVAGQFGAVANPVIRPEKTLSGVQRLPAGQRFLTALSKNLDCCSRGKREFRNKAAEKFVPS